MLVVAPPRQEVESQMKEADSTKSAKDAQPKEELGNRQSPKILEYSPLVVPKKYLTCERHWRSISYRSKQWLPQRVLFFHDWMPPTNMPIQTGEKHTTATPDCLRQFKSFCPAGCLRPLFSARMAWSGVKLLLFLRWIVQHQLAGYFPKNPTMTSHPPQVRKCQSRRPATCQSNGPKLSDLNNDV